MECFGAKSVIFGQSGAVWVSDITEDIAHRNFDESMRYFG